MDLSNLIPKSDTIVVELKHPVTQEVLTKDDGKPQTITTYAPHSAQYKAVIHAQTNKRLQKAAKGKKMTFTSEEIEDSATNMLVDTTKDWDIQLEGKTPKFTPEAVRDVYDKLPWVKIQVLEAQEDLTSFLTN
jgi:tRNA A37 methylthiotransferase MiaB